VRRREADLDFAVFVPRLLVEARPRFGEWPCFVATARLADELSKQYSLGYSSSEPKDGRWHAIRVEVRDRKLLVRARKGYQAS